MRSAFSISMKSRIGGAASGKSDDEQKGSRNSDTDARVNGVAAVLKMIERCREVG
jgi:hypothetical protein